jgi:hypothetical protein
MRRINSKLDDRFFFYSSRLIIENELTFNGIDHKDTTFSLLLKATITFSTILLTGLVFYYHRIDMNLYCVDNSIDDWRIVLTRTKIFTILLEAFICMIHPVPGHFLVEWSSQYVKKNELSWNFLNPYQSGQYSSTVSPGLNGTTSTASISSTGIPSSSSASSTDLPQAYVPIDVMLSLPSNAYPLAVKSHAMLFLLCSVLPIVFALSVHHASLSFGS